MNIHDVYGPFLRYFRTRRMRDFWHRLGVTTESRVLDVGGTPFNWSLLPSRPQLVMLNLSAPREKEQNITYVVADARHLPFKDRAFDVVYSNSVIEHLGNLKDQSLFAAECRRVGTRYYVQTPNKRFFVEPHLITPFIHWMSPVVQRRLMRNFTVRGWITRPTVKQCDDFLRGIRLLDERELRALFPQAEIWRERVLGFTKSLIAVKI